MKNLLTIINHILAKSVQIRRNLGNCPPQKISSDFSVIRSINQSH